MILVFTITSAVISELLMILVRLILGNPTSGGTLAKDLA